MPKISAVMITRVLMKTEISSQYWQVLVWNTYNICIVVFYSMFKNPSIHKWFELKFFFTCSDREDIHTSSYRAAMLLQIKMWAGFRTYFTKLQAQGAIYSI